MAAPNILGRIPKPRTTGRDVGAMAIQVYQIEQAVQEQKRRARERDEAARRQDAQFQSEQAMKRAQLKALREIEADRKKRDAAVIKSAGKGVGGSGPSGASSLPPLPPVGGGGGTQALFTPQPLPTPPQVAAQGIQAAGRALPGIAGAAVGAVGGALGAVLPPIQPPGPTGTATVPTQPQPPPPTAAPAPKPQDPVRVEAERRMAEAQATFAQAYETAQQGQSVAGAIAARKAFNDEQRRIRTWEHGARADQRKAEAKERAERAEATDIAMLQGATDIKDLGSLIRKVDMSKDGVRAAASSMRAQITAQAQLKKDAAKVRDEKTMTAWRKPSRDRYSSTAQGYNQVKNSKSVKDTPAAALEQRVNAEQDLLNTFFATFNSIDPKHPLAKEMESQAVADYQMFGAKLGRRPSVSQSDFSQAGWQLFQQNLGDIASATDLTEAKKKAVIFAFLKRAQAEGTREALRDLTVVKSALSGNLEAVVKRATSQTLTDFGINPTTSP